MVKTILAVAVLTTFHLAAAGLARAQANPPPAPAPDAPATAPDVPATAPAPTAPEPPKPALPRIHHAPPSVVDASADLEVGAIIERPDLVKRAVLVYRHGRAVSEVPFRRSAHATSSPYVAIIPAKDVASPLVAYAIEIETVDGSRVQAFATRADMHPVAVMGDVMDAREQALLDRLNGRRSVVSLQGEYVHFGTSDATVVGADGARTTQRFADAYYRVEGSYTYRFLRTVAEFGIRAGGVRGRSVVAGETDPSKFDVGLNYGAPRLRLRAMDGLHFEAELLTSVTEVGFSGGGGGAVIIGDPYGSRFVLGFESIETFGSRGYSRLDVAASRRIPMVGAMIEVTNMPHAARAGVRLLADVGFDLGAGFGVIVRGGYQARVFESGGPALGLTASYSF